MRSHIAVGALAYLGLDAYEVRGWLGWQHHMTLVMLAMWFLKLETQRLGKKSGGRDHAA